MSGPLVQAIKASFSDSVGDIVFGMEDGTVSIFGLVFGVAASASSSQAVLLAGATGAAAAAVSMMAGTYLDVETARGQARAEIAQKRAEIAHQPDKEAKKVDARLQDADFTPQERGVIITALRRMPGTWLRLEEETQLGPVEKRNPLVQSLWMFAADLFAAAVPVIPFAFLSLGQARTTSVTTTGLLLVFLGIGRAKVARTSLVPTTILESVAIATAAAVAGVLIGKLVSR